MIGREERSDFIGQMFRQLTPKALLFNVIEHIFNERFSIRSSAVTPHFPQNYTKGPNIGLEAITPQPKCLGCGPLKHKLQLLADNWYPLFMWKSSKLILYSVLFSVLELTFIATFVLKRVSISFGSDSNSWSVIASPKSPIFARSRDCVRKMFRAAKSRWIIRLFFK